MSLACLPYTRPAERPHRCAQRLRPPPPGQKDAVGAISMPRWAIRGSLSVPPCGFASAEANRGAPLNEARNHLRSLWHQPGALRTSTTSTRHAQPGSSPSAAARSAEVGPSREAHAARLDRRVVVVPRKRRWAAIAGIYRPRQPGKRREASAFRANNIRRGFGSRHDRDRVQASGSGAPRPADGPAPGASDRRRRRSPAWPVKDIPESHHCGARSSQ